MNTTNTSLIRHFLLVAAVTCVAPAAVDASDDLPDDPRKYFESLLQERASIKYLHVEWSMTVLKDVRYQQLEQCRYNYEGWYDFETGACRVDGQVACPNSQELNGAPRFSFDGEVYRVIYRDNLLGYELHGLDRSYMTTPRSFMYGLSADMRLLGLFPVPYSVLKNFSLADLSRYVNGPKDLKVTSSDGKPVIDVYGFLAQDITASLTLDVDSHMPSRIETREGRSTLGGQRIELQSTWKKYSHHNGTSNFWFPVTVRTRIWSDGVTLSDEELVEVTAVEIGQPPPRTRYEWKSLAPIDGFAVEFRHDDTRVKVEEWDVDKAGFNTWNPKPLEAPQSADIAENMDGGKRWWLIALNIVAIAGIVAWLVVSRKRQSKY